MDKGYKLSMDISMKDNFDELFCAIVKQVITDYKEDLKIIKNLISNDEINKLKFTQEEIEKEKKKLTRKKLNKQNIYTDDFIINNVLKQNLKQNLKAAKKDIKQIRYKFIGSEWYLLICNIPVDLMRKGLDDIEKKILGEVFKGSIYDN